MLTSPERLRRWRLLLGAQAAEPIGVDLSSDDAAIDQTLAALYEPDDPAPARGRGGLGSSAPRVARWLGDIRRYFPASVVKVMQQDALERLNLRQMLLEPELLASVEANPSLVATLLTLQSALPERTRETARQVVRKVVQELEHRLAEPLRQAVTGSLARSLHHRRPRHHEIDWARTIRANLKHYQPAYRTIIPEVRWGFGRKRTALHDVILCLDQSGSMATSIVYAGVCGAVLASLPALRTHVVAFDTAVVDLTEELNDPVDLLFGTQLGGGTDINRALAYAQGLVDRPQETLLVLLSDLFEGGDRVAMLSRAHSLVASGVNVVALLALSDQGAPAFDHGVAAALANLGVPAFACTPDLFPDMMAAALQRQDLRGWAARQGIVTAMGGL